MYHPDQRELLGGPLLSYVAGRQEALPQCLCQNAGGVREETEGAHHGDEGRNCGSTAAERTG